MAPGVLTGSLLLFRGTGSLFLLSMLISLHGGAEAALALLWGTPVMVAQLSSDPVWSADFSSRILRMHDAWVATDPPRGADENNSFFQYQRRMFERGELLLAAAPQTAPLLRAIRRQAALYVAATTSSTTSAALAP